MEHYTTNSWLEEANAGVAGVVSLIANILLSYLTTKVKTYSDTVRWSQYYSCCFRLAFSLLVGITAPVSSTIWNIFIQRNISDDNVPRRSEIPLHCQGRSWDSCRHRSISPQSLFGIRSHILHRTVCSVSSSGLFTIQVSSNTMPTVELYVFLPVLP